MTTPAATAPTFAQATVDRYARHVQHLAGGGRLSSWRDLAFRMRSR